MAALSIVAPHDDAHAQAAAQSVYKCTVDGKPGYSDRPCPGGQALPPPAAGISATAGTDSTDSRLLRDLEQARAQRARQEAIANREQRAQARAGRVMARQVQHCDKLKLQRKWLEQDLAQPLTPARQATLRTKLKRLGESMAVECPA